MNDEALRKAAYGVAADVLQGWCDKPAEWPWQPSLEVGREVRRIAMIMRAASLVPLTPSEGEGGST